ncbi:helix-turn-helix transcriptional regulator [Rhodococcus sp. Q]|uniref:helix-turn-helix domain-containing protein n=1 Tax=Rhodococcus sp. Q TaxID=2502252 RepID=UPI0010F692D8|nr:helix-turn-helix transcriptional regulator [Rhodococcus sp. Q]
MTDDTRSTGDSAGDVAARVVTNAAQDIGSFIKSQREAAQVSLRQLSKLAGVSNPYLSQIERGLRKPSAEVLGQIAKGLRMSSEVLYMRAGLLEERPSGPVRDALLADTSLTERQKQVLLEIYESFRRENAPGTDIQPEETGEIS